MKTTSRLEPFSTGGVPRYPLQPGRGGGRPGANGASIALWLFMVVATMIFSLSSLAYVMRLESAEGYPLVQPTQLWWSTALLTLGSAALQRASVAARHEWLPVRRRWLWVGGVCALAFIGSQLWGWVAMHDARVTLSGNPAGTFFYLLTALHALHVAGGLVAWGFTVRTLRRVPMAQAANRIALCARYWHFLLVIWLALFALMSLLTPELARWICAPFKA
jgi:cytochrome c oxidase subunit 3